MNAKKHPTLGSLQVSAAQMSVPGQFHTALQLSIKYTLKI
jgi:hypothetical protein